MTVHRGGAPPEVCEGGLAEEPIEPFFKKGLSSNGTSFLAVSTPATTAVQPGGKKDFLEFSSVACICSWITSSILTVMYNKHLYVSGGFPFPLTLVMMHQVTMTVLLWSIRFLAPRALVQSLMPASDVHLSFVEWVMLIVPVGIFQASAMACQNEALQVSSVHFVIMVNALKPVLVCILQMLSGLSPYSWLQLKIVTSVSAGVMMAVGGELHFVLYGLVMLIIAQVTEGLRIVMMQRLMGAGHKELDAATLLSYSAPACVLALLPGSLLREVPRMDADDLAEMGVMPLAISTVLAVGVNITSALVIQKTDALVLVLVGILKDFFLIFFSAWFFDAALRPSQVAGYSVAVFFIHVFREYKRNEASWSSYSLARTVLAVLKVENAMLRIGAWRPSSREDAEAKKASSGTTLGVVLCALVICVAVYGLEDVRTLIWTMLAAAIGNNGQRAGNSSQWTGSPIQLVSKVRLPAPVTAVPDGRNARPTQGGSL